MPKLGRWHTDVGILEPSNSAKIRSLVCLHDLKRSFSGWAQVHTSLKAQETLYRNRCTFWALVIQFDVAFHNHHLPLRETPCCCLVYQSRRVQSDPFAILTGSLPWPSCCSVLAEACLRWVYDTSDCYKCPRPSSSSRACLKTPDRP